MLNFAHNYVYIVLGIDNHGHDQVLSASSNFECAKKFVVRTVAQTHFHDLWIEKHPLTSEL